MLNRAGRLGKKTAGNHSLSSGDRRDPWNMLPVLQCPANSVLGRTSQLVRRNRQVGANTLILPIKLPCIFTFRVGQ